MTDEIREQPISSGEAPKGTTVFRSASHLLHLPTLWLQRPHEDEAAREVHAERAVRFMWVLLPHEDVRQVGVLV